MKTAHSEKVPLVPEPKDFRFILTFRRPLLHDLRSPEHSVRIENRFTEDRPGASGKISYDFPALDVSVDFQTHENVSTVLQFVTPADEQPENPEETPPPENLVTLKAVDKIPGILAARNGALVKCFSEPGGNAVVVFDGQSPIPQPFAAPVGAAILGVRNGEFHWEAVKAASPEK